MGILNSFFKSKSCLINLILILCFFQSSYSQNNKYSLEKKYKYFIKDSYHIVVEKSDSIYYRLKPLEKAKVYAEKLDEGDTIKILDFHETLIKVSFKDKEGYINGSLLQRISYPAEHKTQFFVKRYLNRLTNFFSLTFWILLVVLGGLTITFYYTYRKADRALYNKSGKVYSPNNPWSIGMMIILGFLFGVSYIIFPTRFTEYITWDFNLLPVSASFINKVLSIVILLSILILIYVTFESIIKLGIPYGIYRAILYLPGLLITFLFSIFLSTFIVGVIALIFIVYFFLAGLEGMANDATNSNECSYCHMKNNQHRDGCPFHYDYNKRG